MPKSRQTYQSRLWEEDKDTVVSQAAPIYNNSEILVQSIYPAHLKYRGRLSGKLYEWPNAGDTVLVLEEDVPELIAKRIGSGSCCGGGNKDGNVVFRIFEK